MFLSFRLSDLVLVAICSTSALAASSRLLPPESPKVQVARGAKGGDSIHPSIPVVAVADFRATMLSRTEAGALTDSFCSALGANPRHRLVERKLFAGLRNSSDFGPLSQCTQLGCALDIGHQMQADAVVLGQVSREGKGLVLTIRLVDVEYGVLGQKFASKVYSGPEALRERGVPELVARLLDSADTAPEVDSGQSNHSDPSGKPVEVASSEDAQKLDLSARMVSRHVTDTRLIKKESTSSQPIPPKQATWDLAKVAAFGAAATGVLLVGGVAVALSFPSVCADRASDASSKDDGECIGTMLEAGFFLYRAGLVVGGFTAVAGVLAVVQRLLPAKTEVPPNRRLVLVPQFVPTSGAVGLATRLQF